MIESGRHGQQYRGNVLNKKFVFFSFLLFFLVNNCAVVNNNICQTAETLPKGKIRIASGIGTGVDTWLEGRFVNDTDNKDPEVFIKSLTFFDNFGSFIILNCFNFFVDGGYGISDQLEINAKLWLVSLYQVGPGIRLGVKRGFFDSTSAIRLAVMPGLMYGVYNKVYDFRDTSSVYTSGSKSANIQLVGIDIPMILSYKVFDKFQVYCAPSYSGYYMFTTKRDRDDASYSIYLNTIAMHLGLSQKFKRFFIRPEYVLSYQFGSSNHQVLSNTFGIGWGIEF